MTDPRERELLLAVLERLAYKDLPEIDALRAHWSAPVAPADPVMQARAILTELAKVPPQVRFAQMVESGLIDNEGRLANVYYPAAPVEMVPCTQDGVGRPCDHGVCVALRKHEAPPVEAAPPWPCWVCPGTMCNADRCRPIPTDRKAGTP